MKTMVYIVSLLLLFVFLCGCILQIQPQQQANQQQPESQVKLSEGATNIDNEGALQQDKFTISEGKFIIFEGKKITVKELNFRNELTLSIDSHDYVFYETKIMEIVDGLEIYPLEFHFDSTAQDTYVVLQIKKFQPEANQHLLYLEQEISVPNKGTVKLADVFSDDFQSISVQVTALHESKTERIHRMDTSEILGIKITNVYPRPRAIAYEKYAVIKVE